MDIVIRHPVIVTGGSTKTVERHVSYEAARRRVERTIDLTAFDPKPAVLSVYAQIMWGCDHCEVLPDGRHEWVNEATGDRVRLEASL